MHPRRSFWGNPRIPQHNFVIDENFALSPCQGGTSVWVTATLQPVRISEFGSPADILVPVSSKVVVNGQDFSIDVLVDCEERAGLYWSVSAAVYGYRICGSLDRRQEYDERKHLLQQCCSSKILAGTIICDLGSLCPIVLDID